MRRLLTALAVVLVASSGFSANALATAADDQAIADAAIAAFTDRVTAAGWVSEGPTELDAETTDDELFEECEQEYLALQAVFSGEFEGETAQTYSDEFVFVPEDSVPATTEEFVFSIDDEEFVAAFVVSVDDDHRDELVMLVDQIGSPELVECAEQSFAEDMATEASTATSELPIEYTIENDADLGVGDTSASLRIGIDSEMVGGEPFQFDTTMYFAQVDRTLVGVLSGRSGSIDPVSGLDPLAELATLVEDVSA